ncbi:MAG: SDR family oxidoreductase [Candidatus Cloacimonetes bacterium]|nr:SDR family oxidoreductase [Candidatus Cloacimonadota bacterium]
MNKLLLAGKVILISGATGGIGGACALEASREGAIVCLLGRNKEKLNQIQEALSGSMSRSYLLELTDEDALNGVIFEIVKEFGRIDGFIHAAGTEITKPLRNTTRDDFVSLFEINTVSAFLIIKAILRLCKKSESLSFVLISSVMGELGERGKIAYCASKGALISSMKALSLEIAPKNHRINCISPGVVETEMVSKMMKDFPPDMKEDIINQHPLGIGEPQDIAYLSTFLLSPNAKWITGSNFIIDGGYSAR